MTSRSGALRRRLLAAGCALVSLWFALSSASCAKAGPLREDVERFVIEMANKHGFERTALRALFRKARFQPAIAKVMTTPATTRPWTEYFPVFLTSRRVNAGVRFWDENEAMLARATKEYGVPPEIIVATIGVETFFGRNVGSHRMIDALSTLAFDYPRRADFFRKELEEYLLLTRANGFDPSKLKGSYAGAMGIAQFIPSSYRRYAVDYDGDGIRDLWQPADAIGSVANYYREYGWRADEMIVARAGVIGDTWRQFVRADIKPQTTLAEFRNALVTVREPLAGDLAATLFTLEAEEGTQYWLGLHNFYAITRYNRSIFYAMTVFQLSQAIVSARRQGDPQDSYNETGTQLNSIPTLQ